MAEMDNDRVPKITARFHQEANRKYGNRNLTNQEMVETIMQSAYVVGYESAIEDMLAEAVRQGADG